MRALLIAVVVTLGVAVHAEAQTGTCTTPQPGPNWVCVSGGWLPPGHPGIPTTPPPPPIDQPQPAVPFRIGHRYTRNVSGTATDVYISGAGQTRGGVSVLFAECAQEGDGCLFKGHIRMFLSNASAADWADITNAPY